MMLEVNDRVLAGKYGPGTVLGFECFDHQGKSMEPDTTDDPGSTSRVIVQLDNPEAWPCHNPTGLNPHPYMARQHLMLEPTLY